MASRDVSCVQFLILFLQYVSTLLRLQISAAAGPSNPSFERHANLRSGSPANGHGVPHTGLSMLMSGGGGFKLAQPPHSLAVAPASFAAMSGINPERRTPTGFLEERERQASALAAAGMVAETVGIANDPRKQPAGMPSQGLQAPPPLATGVPMTSTTTAAATEIDSANWGLMDMGGVQIDDMDLDFATLFDPALEEANMQMEGSGWPSAAATRDMPVSPTSLATMQQQQHHQHLKPAPPTSGNPSSYPV